MPVQTAPRPDAPTTPAPISAPHVFRPRPVSTAPASRWLRMMSTRISGLRNGLIGGVLALVVLVIFIIQNAHTVQVSFLGVNVRLSLALALLLALIVGALLMAAAGTARITQLRRAIQRTRRSVAQRPADASEDAS